MNEHFGSARVNDTGSIKLFQVMSSPWTATAACHLGIPIAWPNPPQNTTASALPTRHACCALVGFVSLH